MRRLKLPRRRDKHLQYLYMFVAFFCTLSFMYSLQLLFNSNNNNAIPIMSPAAAAVMHADCTAFTTSKDTAALLVKPSELSKLEQDITNGWNKPSSSRILVVGTSGYIKRDLPIYEMAFAALPQFSVVRNPLPPSAPASANKKAKPAATLTDNDYDALLCLSFNTDSCLLPEQFPELVPRNKKINRINYLRPILWSKHSFCNTLSRSTKHYSLPREESFFFPCWVLPDQYDELQLNELQLTRWISKPRSLGAGMGISIIENLREVPMRSTHVIQEYMMSPFLLRLSNTNTLHKWDMRTYVLVTSVVPMRAYVFERGLVRFAMTAYSNDCKSNNQTACLTNTSINKKIGAGSAKDITWPFTKLKQALGDDRYAVMFEKMKRAIGMTLLSALPEFISMQSSTNSYCESCYQLLGVDVIFDDELNPKVIECNGEPSMQLNGGKASHYDTTKKIMIQNLVDLVFQPKPANKRFASVLQQKCGNANQQMRRGDAAYMLDLYREQVAQREFSRIYPATNPLHAKQFRDYLSHMSTSSEFTRKTQLKMKELVRSHDVFARLLPENTAETAATAVAQDEDDDEDDV